MSSLSSIKSFINYQKTDENYPILVHSDIVRSRHLIPENMNLDLMLNQHIFLLEELTSEGQLYFPAFNYDFTKTGVYDPKNDISQVGALSEFARQNWSHVRFGPPVFNFCTNLPKNHKITCTGNVDPFGNESFFRYLFDHNGIIMMYGAFFSNLTFLHFIESYAGNPVYRYDKKFKGHVLQEEDKSRSPVTLNYHCRPAGSYFDYDWPKLDLEMQRNKIMKKYTFKGCEIILIKARPLTLFINEQVLDDPLYLLDHKI